MFSNIGKKIKLAAQIMFWLEAISFVILGIVFLAEGYDEMIIFGLVFMLAGPFISWIMSWFLYGFGEIIDKLTDIERNTRGNQPMMPVPMPVPMAAPMPAMQPTQPVSDPARTANLENLRQQGLITEEEYLKAINK